MKFRLLLSFLFIIATTFTAIHELEHIAHDDPSCQVCVLGDNSLSFDVIDDFKKNTLFSCDIIDSKKSHWYTQSQRKTNQANAPPTLS